MCNFNLTRPRVLSVFVVLLLLFFLIAVTFFKNPGIIQRVEALTPFSLKSLYDLDKDGRITGKDISFSTISRLNSQNVSTLGSKTIPNKGFIIQFQDNSVIEFSKKNKVKNLSAKVVNLNYQKSLLSNHEMIKRDILAKLKKDKLPIIREYTKVFSGIVLDITQNEANEIKKLPNIKAVYPNYQIHTVLMDSVPLIKATDVWNLKDDNNNNITGQGVTVAVIDTGIDYTHQDLGGCSTVQFLSKQCPKVITGYDFHNNDSDPIDDHGHGTHVAATVAGNGVLKGVAPDAKLVAYKVLDSGGFGYFDTIIAGIEASVDPNGDSDFSDHWDVISMSLGGFGNPDDPLAQSVDQAVNAGVTVVVAAGNEGPDQFSIDTPGVSRKAITVGATDKSDKMADFSSRGPIPQILGEDYELIKPNVVAPGVLICAARLPSFQPWLSNPEYSVCGGDDKHVYLSGTSMATPHVAGVAALVKQTYRDWSPEDIKSAITTTAVDLGEIVTVQGSGRVDALKSVQTSTLLNPTNLSFGLVDKTKDVWITTKDTTVKNASSKNTQSYSFKLKQSINGATVSFSENNFFLQPKEAKIIKITLSVDNSVLADGFYSNEVQLTEGGNLYRLPMLFHRSADALQLLTDKKYTKKDYYAKILTPYNYLNNSPSITIKSPSGKEVVISSLIKADDYGSVWKSPQLYVDEEGSYLLTATTNEMPGYSSVTTLIADITPPNFEISETHDQNYINWQIASSEELSPAFSSHFADSLDPASTLHWMPSIYAENNNIYMTYEYLSYTENGIHFVKSTDRGYTWDSPVKLFTGQGNLYDPSFASSSITKFNNQLFVAFTDNGNMMRLFISKDDGKTWNLDTPVIIDPSNSIIIDTPADVVLKQAQEKLHIAYAVKKDPLHVSIRYASSNDGVNWTQPKEVAEVTVVYGLDMDINKGGVRIYYTDSQSQGIHYVFSSDGINWANKEIERSAGLLYAYPSAVSSDSMLFVAWSEGMYGPVHFARSSDNGNTWIVKKDVLSSSPSIFAKLGFDGNKLYLFSLQNVVPGPLYLHTSGDLGNTWENKTTLDNGYTWIGAVAPTISSIHYSWSTTPTSQLRVVYANGEILTGKITYNGVDEIIKDAVKLPGNLWGVQTAFKGYGDYTVEASGSDLAGNLGKTTKTVNMPFLCTACAADVNKDHYVNGADVSKIVPCYNKKATDLDYKGIPCTYADINGDGEVNDQDTSCISSQILKTCE